MWDEKFSREGFLYGLKPNQFLKDNLQLIEKNSDILFLGEGEGRSALYAATLGFNVSALDASEVGLQKTEQRAQEMKVELKTILADLDIYKYETSYSSIMCSFLHLPNPLRREAFKKALSALKMNGLFIAEFFSTAQLPLKSGGPKMEELLYTLDSVKEIFDIDGFEIILMQECKDLLDEGVGHQGEAELIRVIVKRVS